MINTARNQLRNETGPACKNEFNNSRCSNFVCSEPETHMQTNGWAVTMADDGLDAEK
jgi:hypothetical protein